MGDTGLQNRNGFNGTSDREDVAAAAATMWRVAPWLFPSAR